MLLNILMLTNRIQLISIVLGVLVILAITCLVGALSIAKFLQPQRVVTAPSARKQSNHDLADRQARARLNLEYRQARLRETVQDHDMVETVKHRSEEAHPKLE